MDGRASPQWWPILRWVALVVFAVPPVVIAACRFAPPPVTPFMVLRWLGGAGLDYRWVPLTAMSPAIPRAVIASEDARFVRHHGFDWVEIGKAWDAGQKGRRLRGASTITQQCARMLLLWPGRGIVRKLAEAYVTLWLEALWSKRRILEVYLNIVDWGEGVYGCEAAARRAFGTSCAALGAQNAARLVAILPNPQRWSAASPSGYIRKRAARILRRMDDVAVPAR